MESHPSEFVRSLLASIVEQRSCHDETAQGHVTRMLQTENCTLYICDDAYRELDERERGYRLQRIQACASGIWRCSDETAT